MKQTDPDSKTPRSISRDVGNEKYAHLRDLCTKENASYV